MTTDVAVAVFLKVSNKIDIPFTPTAGATLGKLSRDARREATLHFATLNAQRPSSMKGATIHLQGVVSEEAGWRFCVVLTRIPAIERDQLWTD